MNEIRGIYQTAIHPGQINIWYEPLTRAGRKHSSPPDSTGMSDEHGPVPEQFKDNRHKGRISPVALKKIQKAVNYMVWMVPRRKYFTTADGRAGNYFLSFITLTLSSDQIHSDYEIKQHCLEPFLNEMRKRWKISNYIWRAEKQANGNLHFHIVSDRFIWWSDLRNSWNFYQEKLGYISRYRDSQKAWHAGGFKIRESLEARWSRPNQIKAYKSGQLNDWNSPNSTDVHSLKTVNSVRSYICKYITKSEDRQNISGRLWSCSSELSNIPGSREYADGYISDELDRLQKPGICSVYKGDYYTVIFFTRKILQDNLCYNIIASLDKYLLEHFPDYHSVDLWPLDLAA